MDPELLALLLEYLQNPFGGSGDTSTSDPYVPSLTDYLDDYYASIAGSPTLSDAGVSQNVGATDSGQIGGYEPMPPLTTSRTAWDNYISPIPFLTDVLSTANPEATSWVATGVRPDMTFENGTFSLGEQPLGIQQQLISNSFQQYPVSGAPRPASPFFSALAAAAMQANQNGGRQASDLTVTRSNQPIGVIPAPVGSLSGASRYGSGFPGGGDEPRDKKVQSKRVNAQQAAQAVQAVARNAVYQRPAPVYRPSPAPVYTPAPSPVAQAVGRLVRNAASSSRSGRSLF